MTDPQWISFVLTAGETLPERIRAIENLAYFGKAAEFTTQEWITLDQVLKLLLEQETANRVEKIKREAPQVL